MELWTILNIIQPYYLSLIAAGIAYKTMGIAHTVVCAIVAVKLTKKLGDGYIIEVTWGKVIIRPADVAVKEPMVLEYPSYVHAKAPAGHQ